jgi:hypothetical protein
MGSGVAKPVALVEADERNEPCSTRIPGGLDLAARTLH